MTPKQKIKKEILIRACENGELENNLPVLINENNIEELYKLNSDQLCDTKYNFREGDAETELPCDWSRHYESKSVAAKTGDGWVGWTYWYGGGKHGEPEAIDWMSEAYDLEVVEEEKMVVVRTFKKVG